MPRHVLTTEERRKGAQATNARLAISKRRHVFTTMECSRGGAVLAIMLSRNAASYPSRHVLTREDRSRGGKTTARKRLAKRLANALAKAFEEIKSGMAGDWWPQHERVTPQDEARLESMRAETAEVLAENAKLREELGLGPQGQVAEASAWLDDGAESREPKWVDPSIPIAEMGPEMLGPPSVKSLLSAGASLADKLMEPVTDIKPADEAQRLGLERIERETIDPFTLSALKRFRFGPVSPFHLTRSQRAHVDVMRAEGYVERTKDDHLALTEKGRKALGDSA